MKKVVIFSDSHGSNQTMKKVLKMESPDLVIHAGDHCLYSPSDVYEIVDWFVAGNNDYVGNQEEVFVYEGIKFAVTHGHFEFDFDVEKWEQKLYYKFLKEQPKVIVYGHSHNEQFYMFNGTIIVNPGSIERPRNKSGRRSYMVLNIKDGKIVEEKLEEAIRYL